MNSFQLTTIWILSVSGIVGTIWLLLAGKQRQGRDALRLSRARPYRIDNPFVEIRIDDGSSLGELRSLFESIRDDPALPQGALLLFDGTARTERLAEKDVRARLRIFLDIMRPRMAPAYAVIVSSAIAWAAETAQREAAVDGIRVGLFLDFDRARRWLSTYAVGAGHS